MDNFLEEFKKLKEKVEALEKRALSSLKLDSLTTGIIKPSSDSTSAIKITKADGTTNILNIDSNNQRVGIGTTSPLWPLDVKGKFFVDANGRVGIGTQPDSNYGLTVNTGIAHERIKIQGSTSSGFYLIDPSGTDGAIVRMDTDGLKLYTQNAVLAMMLAKTSGNVGIGTTSPGAKLEVSGVWDSLIKATESISGKSIWINSGTNFASIGYGTTNEKAIAIGQSNGNVGIGTTAPGYKLDVNGQCHASSFPTSSDKRFKENVKEIDNALEKVKKLRGVYFNWNKFYRKTLKVDETEDVEIGLIAQEVKKVIPEVVTTFEREVDGKKEKYYSVEYARLSALLINAIKELSLKVENLEKKIWRN